MFLQSYVVPVCTYEKRGGKAHLKSLHGTAFFINSSGAFISAGHVMNEAQKYSTENGLRIGLCVKGNYGTSTDSMITHIEEFERAPKPFDIAIGQTQHFCETKLAIRDEPVHEWQDVATYGYPINAVSGSSEGPKYNIRCKKGYVQRTTQPDDIPLGSHPNGFELSFLVDKGMSGGPLFISKGKIDVVIGVCVASYRSQILEDRFEETDENGFKIIREIAKIDEYGFAHDLRSLLNWQPNFCGGRSLEMVVSSSS